LVSKRKLNSLMRFNMFNYKKTYLLPFKFEIPSYLVAFFEKNSLIKIYLKYLKRYLYIILKRQNKLEINQILAIHNSILWINLSAPSIGDSLMDLSNRVLIKDRKIDLFSDKKNSHLFFNDEIFKNIYTHTDEIKSNQYDLVVLDSFSTRSIKIKAKVAPLTPFIGMFGYYNGPEVNRVLFGFHRMNQLLGYKMSEDEINSSSKVSLSISEEDCQIVKNFKLPQNYISIAIGGEWDYRTYNKWGEVITCLINGDVNLKIALVGSSNALKVSEELLEKISSNNIFNCVNKFSFMQTAEIINKSKLLICCDGGLMHAANSSHTPILPLFARLTPAMQLTDCIISFSLYDKEDVNNIEVKNILKSFSDFSSYVDNHLQVL
jgi:ADP-heptose:LPS heptosyltransferase